MENNTLWDSLMSITEKVILLPYWRFKFGPTHRAASHAQLCKVAKNCDNNISADLVQPRYILIMAQNIYKNERE